MDIQRVAPDRPLVALTYSPGAEVASQLRSVLAVAPTEWSAIIELPGHWAELEQSTRKPHSPRITHASPVTFTVQVPRTYAEQEYRSSFERGVGRAWAALVEVGTTSGSTSAFVVLLAELQVDSGPAPLNRSACEAWISSVQLLFDPGVGVWLTEVTDPRGARAPLVQVGGSPGATLGPGAGAALTRNHLYPVTTWWVPDLDGEWSAELGEPTAGEWPARMIRKQPKVAGAVAPVSGADWPASLNGPTESVVVLDDTALCVQREPDAVRLITLIMGDVRVAAARDSILAAADRALQAHNSLRALDATDSLETIRAGLREAMVGIRGAQEDLAVTAKPVVATLGVSGGVFAVDYVRARCRQLRLADQLDAARGALKEVGSSVRLRRDELELRESQRRQEATDQALNGIRELLDTGSQVRLVASIASVFLVLLSAASLFAALGAFPSAASTRWLGGVWRVMMATGLTLSVFMAIAIGLVLFAGHGSARERTVVWVGIAVSSSSAAMFLVALSTERFAAHIAALAFTVLAAGIAILAVLIRERKDGPDPVHRLDRQTVVECFLVALDHDVVKFRALPPAVCPPTQEPGDVAVQLVHRSGSTSEYVHSTSWRIDSANSLVLTHLAVTHLTHVPGWVEVAGHSYVPTADVPLEQLVVGHGLRHFALLITTDPAAAGRLGQEWARALQPWEQGPSGEFRAPRQHVQEAMPGL